MRLQEGGVWPSGQRAQDARASPWKRLRSLSLSVVLGLVAVVCPASAQPVIDYPDGSTNASGIVISTNTTQLQVLVGSATQSGVISETGGARPIQKIGVGTLNLTAANTYTGLTTISAGALNIQTATALGTVRCATSRAPTSMAARSRWAAPCASTRMPAR